MGRFGSDEHGLSIQDSRNGVQTCCTHSLARFFGEDADVRELDELDFRGGSGDDRMVVTYRRDQLHDTESVKDASVKMRQYEVREEN